VTWRTLCSALQVLEAHLRSGWTGVKSLVMSARRVPPVNPVDLKTVWNFWRDFEAHHPGAGVGKALAKIDRGPSSDLYYWASYRAAILYLMTLDPADPLAPWRRGLGLDDIVFRVAAVFPMEWVGEGMRARMPFDVDAFLQQLKSAFVQ
jgi:hypothetical protein